MHVVYVLTAAESKLWNSGQKGVMGMILKSATAEVRARGAARFSLFDAEENLLIRIPLDVAAWTDPAT